MTTTALTNRRSASDAWPTWVLDAVLWTLFLGPALSPLLRATGAPVVADVGWYARDLMATYVCPTPERSMLLLGLPMVVCVRCWGATVGLLAARSLMHAHTRGAVRLPLLDGFRALSRPLRLLICAVPFALWPLEIVGHYQGWFWAPMWLLLLNGAQAGLAAGLLLCSLWPGLWPARRRS